jgi:hypothetical protein
LYGSDISNNQQQHHSTIGSGNAYLRYAHVYDYIDIPFSIGRSDLQLEYWWHQFNKISHHGRYLHGDGNRRERLYGNSYRYH